MKPVALNKKTYPTCGDAGDRLVKNYITLTVSAENNSDTVLLNKERWKRIGTTHGIAAQRTDPEIPLLTAQVWSGKDGVSGSLTLVVTHKSNDDVESIQCITSYTYK